MSSPKLCAWMFILAAVFLLGLTRASSCPRDWTAVKLENGRRCRPVCQSSDDCRSKDECVCDDHCGMSCVNTKKKCRETLSIDNGAITYSTRRVKYLTTAEYTCNDGYVLEGSAVRTCRSDGQFSGHAPVCIKTGTEVPATTTEGPTEPTPTTTTMEPTETTEKTEEETEIPVTTTDYGTDGIHPEICTEDNKGHCECGDTSKGFTTYTFTVRDEKRCFTVYHPLNRLDEAIPVVIGSQCYGKDRLSSIGMKSERTDENKAAARYGFARIGISTPDGGWTFGNDGVVNNEHLMPCSENDSKDISYLKVVFNWIVWNSDKYLDSRVYAEGFSQNSMFSAYLGFCFSEHVAGVWQGGSGMALNGLPPTLPGAQAQCTASVYQSYGRQCTNQENACPGCKYWPIYPCYQPLRPMSHCIAEYDNDPISSGKTNPELYSSGRYMYDASIGEGHNAIFLRFSESADKTIPGMHKNQKNVVYWEIACWGLTETCTSECEESFVICVNDENPDSAADEVTEFQTCIEEYTFSRLKGCTATCSPTLGMMKASESPTVIENEDGFGQTSTTHSQPKSSICPRA